MMQVVSCPSELKSGVKSLALNNDVARILLFFFWGENNPVHSISLATATLVL